MDSMRRTVDFQAGGSNPHYGRIAYWLAAGVARRLPEVVVNLKVGKAYENLDAVGAGLAQIGVTTPGVAARQCLLGQGTFADPRPDLRSIGVVPHRDELVFGAIEELGIETLGEIRQRAIPLRLVAPPEEDMVGFAARRAMEEHGLTPELLAANGGRWIDVDNAQAGWKMVADGRADAMVHESVIMAFRPLSRARPIRLVPMEPAALGRLEAKYGYAWKQCAPESCVGQQEPVAGLDWNHWIVVAQASLADDLAAALADVFLNDTWRLERLYTADNRLPWGEHPLDYPMRPEVVSNEVSIPLHAGAAARYREAGVLA